MEAMNKAGNMPCIMNAANEIAVQLFLEGKIRFTDIPVYIKSVMHSSLYKPNPTIDDYISSDREARDRVTELVTM
jgi:1-deoxy-D-xylulose-5-phosphate reductoisomerase